MWYKGGMSPTVASRTANFFYHKTRGKISPKLNCVEWLNWIVTQPPQPSRQVMKTNKSIIGRSSIRSEPTVTRMEFFYDFKMKGFYK